VLIIIGERMYSWIRAGTNQNAGALLPVIIAMINFDIV